MAMVHSESANELIPDSVTFGGTYRAISKKSFNALRQRIEEVSILSRYMYSIPLS